MQIVQDEQRWGFAHDIMLTRIHKQFSACYGGSGSKLCFRSVLLVSQDKDLPFRRHPDLHVLLDTLAITTTEQYCTKKKEISAARKYYIAL